MDGSLEAPTNNYQSLNRSSKKVVPGIHTVLHRTPHMPKSAVQPLKLLRCLVNSSNRRNDKIFVHHPEHVFERRQLGHSIAVHCSIATSISAEGFQILRAF